MRYKIGLLGQRFTQPIILNFNSKLRIQILRGDEYGIKWSTQEFTWDGWQGTVYVKAKEDLLGGNAVKTKSAAPSRVPRILKKKIKTLRFLQNYKQKRLFTLYSFLLYKLLSSPQSVSQILVERAKSPSITS